MQVQVHLYMTYLPVRKKRQQDTKVFGDTLDVMGSMCSPTLRPRTIRDFLVHLVELQLQGRVGSSNFIIRNELQIMNTNILITGWSIKRPNATIRDIKNIKGVKRNFTIIYTLNGASTKAFSANRVPRFSSTNAYTGDNTPSASDNSSDWTNSIPADNGGTEISISGITSVLSADGGTSNGICTLTFNVSILKWGTKDVTMDLDLDKIVTAG